MIHDSYHHGVGYRFLRWTAEEEPGLTTVQKARAYEKFAAEFEVMPSSREPYQGWAEVMAYLCHRLARRHRGEPVGEWIPEWERAARRATS